MLKSKNSSLLEIQRIRDEAMLKTTSMIESLRSEVVALRPAVPVKSHAKVQFEAAESEQLKKQMENYLFPAN